MESFFKHSQVAQKKVKKEQQIKTENKSQMTPLNIDGISTPMKRQGFSEKIFI